MQHSTKSGKVRRRFAPHRTLWIGLLCMGVFSAYALAQNTAPPKPKAKPAPSEKAKEQVPPKEQPKGTPGAKAAPKGASIRQHGRNYKRDAGFVMNPDAKWACDQQTVTLEPTWRANKPLTFPFEIRNEGTANLQIKAKGG